MAKVSIQKITVTIDHAPNYGTACKQMFTQVAEAMGLSLVTVETDSTSVYSAYYCYNNDLRFQVRLYNSSYYIYYTLVRKDSSGKLSSIVDDRLVDIDYNSSGTYHYHFMLVTVGTLKCIRQLSTSTYHGFGFATMINVYDSKTYPIVLRIGNDGYSPSVDVYTMLDDYSLIRLAQYNMSDTAIPCDGKFYLVPIRFGDTAYNIMGSPGEASYYKLMSTSMFGYTSALSLSAGSLLSIGGTPVVGMWSKIFIGLE